MIAVIVHRVCFCLVVVFTNIVLSGPDLQCNVGPDMDDEVSPAVLPHPSNGGSSRSALMRLAWHDS